MTFTAKVQGPDGPQEFQVELNPQQTVGDARQRLAQQGFQLVDLVPQRPVPPSTTTTATTTRAISPADVGQAAGGGIAGPLGAVAARMALTERVPARAGSPELEPLARTAVRGARQAIPGELLAGGLKAAGTAGRFLGSMARGRALPALRAAMATRDLPGAKQEVLRAMGEEAKEVSRVAQEGLRQTVGQVFSESATGPTALRQGIRETLYRVTGRGTQGRFTPTAQTIAQKVYDATGINPFTVTTKEMERALAKDPVSLVEAIRILESETGIDGAPLLRTVRQHVLSTVAQRAVRRSVSSRFPRAGEGGVLDIDRLRSGLAAMRKTLGEDGLRKVFGLDHVRELDRLSERLGHASAADTERLVAHLRRVGLPTTIQEVAQPAPDPDRLLGFMRQDKKVHGGNLRFVLVRGLGHAFVSSEVPLGSVKAVLAD